ncbi:MAG: (2Fe-2S)-binding protein [Spirochaetales bacterium]|nr:(2Fe-2S)-binding protein [Spirochaetales bacterium]
MSTASVNILTLNLKINGRDYCVSCSPDASLSSVLRDNIGLSGTKEGCGSGECGCCTVLLDSKSVKSCITPAFRAEGAEVITIEGLSSPVHPLHPVQEAFVEAGAIQCGFCTPGFVLSAYSLLKEIPNPDEQDIKNGLSGNICRCTGYETIFKAVQLAAEKLNSSEREARE